MICTCSTIDKHNFQIVFEYVGSKAQPYINDKAKQYIHDLAGDYGPDMIYLLCEEMHFQCMIQNRKLGDFRPTIYVSKFIACSLCCKIKLTTPLDYRLSKVMGIPIDEFSILEFPNFLKG